MPFTIIFIFAITLNFEALANSGKNLEGCLKTISGLGIPERSSPDSPNLGYNSIAVGSRRLYSFQVTGGSHFLQNGKTRKR